MVGSLAAKRLALDTNVLFDLANEEAFARDFRTAFQEHGFSLEVPPRVISELVDLQQTGDDDEQRAADRSLRLMRIDWGLSPIVLRDVEVRYKINFVDIAQTAEILPPGEINDLHILAETAIAGIPGLVTSDRHLLEADSVALQLAFQDAGLANVTPVHPARMARSLRR